MKLHELPIVPARENLTGVLWNIIGRLQQVAEFVQLLGPTGRDLVLVKPPRNAKLLLREGIVIPADAADNRNLVLNERLILKPLPANNSHPPRQFLFEQPIAVITPRPQFMIPGDEQFWSCKLKSLQTSLQRIAIACGRITDDQQHIKIHPVDAIDQLVGQAGGLAVVVVQVGGGENPHDYERSFR